MWRAWLPLSFKGLTVTLFKKGLTENPKNHLNLMNLAPNPIGVINRRNGL
jgi:hypothetical protein